MAQKYVYFEGLDALQKGLMDRAKMDAVKNVVKFDGAQMQQEMMRNAVFKKGYSQGSTQRSITMGFEDGGMTVFVEPRTNYSPYVEWGTRFMDAQPFVRPTFNHMKAQFKAHMDRLFK